MYVVTGATGRTGRVVAESLLTAGEQVRAIGRHRSRLEPLSVAGAEVFVTEPDDVASLAQAFRGAQGAYVMVQPNYIADSPDFRAHQHRVVGAMVEALEGSGVARVVTLSSWGADKRAGTGPVVGLHHLEQRMNTMSDVALTHVRAGYFMENLLGQVESIVEHGLVSAPFDPHIPMPFVAASDIGRLAAAKLMTRAPGIGGPEVVEAQGERDLSMADATRVLAQVLDRPELQYRQLTIAEFAAEQDAAGVSENVVALMVEVANAINSGHTRSLQPRSADTTTPTSLEAFTDSVLRGAVVAASG